MGPPSQRGHRRCTVIVCYSGTMATPGELGPFADRRLRFAAALGDALAIIPGAQEARRNGDVNYEFRQSSDFFFLTGFDEPDAVAVVNPAHTKERYVLFVRPRDRDLEIWTGHRAGVEGAVATYGADAAYPIDQLDEKLREYLVDRPVVYYRLGQGAFDGRVTRLVVELRGARARGYAAPVRLEDPGPILHEMRLRRSPAELARQRRACELSRDAHVEAMRYARPGLYEYQVQAALEFVFRSQGSPRNAYPSIVASGPNACILHYVENTRQLQDGELLLIDAGCEWGYHAADITRTFPVNGRFTAPQRETATFYLREYSEDEMWERRFRLGLAAAKRLEEEEKAKAPKIVHPIPKEFLGIGVRIEDDVLITADVSEVLTAGTPKTVDEIERVCAEPPRLPR